MSFIHRLSLGHFDESSITDVREVIVLRPLDAAVVDECLVARYGVSSSDAEALATFKISCRDGTVEGVVFSPGPNRRFVDFALDLQARTGCVMADLRCRGLMSRAGLEDTRRVPWP